MDLVSRFLRYSLERERKICLVMLDEAGGMKKRNVLVTAVDEDGAGFTALLPGRKREQHYDMAQVLTAAYARGDQGELE